MAALPGFPPLTAAPLPPSTTSKRVYFIRHGETDANASGMMQGSGVDLPLSILGKAQAAALGKRFESEKVDLVVVSTLKRTAETANYIKQFHPNARTIELKDLVEISWGEWEGLPPTKGITDLWKAWEDGNFDAASPGGGESPIDVEARAVPAIYNILRQCLPTEQNIAFVLHGRLIRIILASILNHDLSYMNTYHHANTCINVLDAVILDPESAKDDELKRRFVNGVQTILNRGPSMIDAVGASLPTTPNTVTRAVGKALNPTLAHPNDIVFRAVVLNDTAHLARL
ncbi:hypothetical protein HDU79_002260 [Rhizoclosmatium sp. JEL0117]|nr:hypothetical protein HDU79_002260 [Rhizoclosmatium sp. JEL0117]